MNRCSLWVCIAALAACGGGQQHAATSGSSGSSGSASTAPENSDAGSAGSGSPSDAASGAVHHGVEVHIANPHAGGSLVSPADPPVDHLDVSFELQIGHTGDRALTGIAISHVRLVHDDGREIVFGVLGDNWDGRLEPAATRTVTFHKTPDSATPRPNNTFCGQHMRLEVTVDLAGHQAIARSRHIAIECTASH